MNLNASTQTMTDPSSRYQKAKTGRNGTMAVVCRCLNSEDLKGKKMSNIENLDDHRPHITGQAICRDCRYIWQAVAPENTFDLECPSCHKINGYIDLNLDADGHYDDMDD